MTSLTIAPWGWTVAAVWLFIVVAVVVVYCGRQFRTILDETPEPDLPPDPVDLANMPPEDIGVCDHCDGAGGIWGSGDDPQFVYDCPVCGGEGILPEYQAAS